MPCRSDASRRFLRSEWRIASRSAGPVAGDLAAEEAGNLLGLHAQHALADQLVIERAERSDGAEGEVGGIFRLHQTPVVGRPEHIDHRATPRGIAVQSLV